VLAPECHFSVFFVEEGEDKDTGKGSSYHFIGVQLPSGGTHGEMMTTNQHKRWGDWFSS
jgi:hypothetical protein